MDVTINGAGTQGNIEAQVDPTQQAIRASIRPLDHIFNSQIGGHYGITAYSGTIAASLGANSALFSMRWADPTKVLVLKRVFAWITVTGVPAALTTYSLEVIRATNFTASFGANNTNTTPATAAQKMRTSNMAGSVFSVSGAIQICTTAGMTGQTYTLDTAGFATNTLQGTVGTGASGGLVLYDENEFGQHPLVLSTNEGVVIRNPIAYPGTATAQIGVQVLWSEVASY